MLCQHDDLCEKKKRGRATFLGEEEGDRNQFAARGGPSSEIACRVPQ